MSDELDAARADPIRPKPAAKVLQSMKNHWSGLTVLVQHPWVPMDNNVAERAARLPVDIDAFLAWAMDDARLGAMRAGATGVCRLNEGKRQFMSPTS